MNVQSYNNNFNLSEFTSFSHDSKIVELCNELYEEAKRMYINVVNNYQ